MSALCLVSTPLWAARGARRLCDAQGGLLFGPRVATPGDLVAGILAAAGDRRPLLGPLAERLLVLQAAGDAGRPFAGIPPAGGLARELARTVAELRHGGATEEAMSLAARDLAGRPGERLAAAAALLAAYQQRLAGLGALDTAAAEVAAAAAVRRGVESEATRGLDLLVLEGLTGLAPASAELVAALASRARRTVARLPWYRERPDLSGPAESLLRRLEELGGGDVEMVFRSIADGGRAPRLAHLLGAVAGGPAGGSAPEPGRVLGVPAAGEVEEAEAAARTIADLLDQGMAPEEVAVVSADPGEAAPLLARALAAGGIPFASGRGPPLAESPPVRVLRRALGAAGGLDRSAAESLLSSSYLGLARPPARLAALLDRAGAWEGRGEPAAALRRRADQLGAPAAARERGDLVAAAGALDGLVVALRPLAGPATGREWARRLRAFAAARGVRRRAAGAEPAVAHRDLSALRRVEEIAEDLGEALALVGRGAEALLPPAYLALLDAALGAAAAPPAPEPAAGAVELWSLAEAPGLSAEAVVLLGCRRGWWPPPPRAEVFLRDPERAAVNRRLRRAALATAASRRQEAQHRAFCALAAARQALVFLWSAEGGVGPAPLAASALAAAGVEPGPPATDPPLGRARSGGEALRAVARLARAGREEEALAALRSAGSALVARAEGVVARGALERERRRAVLARAACPGAGLVPASLVGALAAALPAEWSPSQLEMHAVCPFRFFLAEVAGLEEPEANGPDADPRQEGRLVHAVLERFLAARRARGAWPLSGDAADREEAREVAREVMDRFQAEGRVGDPAVWAARREAVLARLDRFVEVEARLWDGLSPELLEHRFGGASGLPAVALRDGGDEVRLAGRIDRVDADGERLHVIDYKNGRTARDLEAALDPAALGVTSFQLPVYLLAAARDLPGRARLSAGYALLRSGERSRSLELVAGDDRLALDEARRARVRAAGGRTFADGVLEAVRHIRSGAYPIASRGCAGCGLGAVCRFQSAAEAPS